jgi:hypothetical protein
VLDWQAMQLTAFNADGRFASVISRQGPGPGELHNSTVVLLGVGDTIHVANLAGRIDVFSPDGRFVRRVLTPREDEPVSVLHDGSYMMARREFPDFERPGAVDNVVVIYRLSADGDSSADLARYLWRISTLRVGSGRRLNEMLRPLEPIRFAHGSSSGFVWCDAGSFRCDLWNADGTMERSLRVLAPPVPVTADDMDVWVAVERGRMAHQDFEDRSAGVERPPAFPFFSTYRVDASDRIWFRMHTRRHREVSDEWLVLASDGTLLGRFAMPPMKRLLRIGADYVLGVEAAESGEEWVVLFPHAPVRREAKQ